jgi:hypothetical protein
MGQSNWVGEGFFFIFPWFPKCSHYVPFKFPLPTPNKYPPLELIRTPHVPPTPLSFKNSGGTPPELITSSFPCRLDNKAIGILSCSYCNKVIHYYYSLVQLFNQKLSAHQTNEWPSYWKKSHLV